MAKLSRPSKPGNSNKKNVELVYKKTATSGIYYVPVLVQKNLIKKKPVSKQKEARNG